MNNGLKNILMVLSLLGSPSADAQPSFQSSQLPDLPGLNGQSNPGVAGAFAGFSHGALLVAGGANFPDGYPWQGGTKVWQSTIYVLSQPGKSTHWQPVGQLQRPLAYGASVVWQERIICLGGNDARQRYADVFTLTWDTGTGKVQTEAMPSLPLTLANLSAALLNDDLYVFGGETSEGPSKKLFVLSLRNTGSGWQTRADLPGPARAFTALVAMPQTQKPGLFVLGGRQTVDGQTTVFKDAYQYDPNRDQWTRLPDLPVAVAAHTASERDANRLLIFGGDDGIRLRKIETLNTQIKRQPNQAGLVAKRNDLQANHPGFRREIWQFRTDTQHWSVVARMPFPAPVTTTVVRWKNAFVLPSGEISPGVRTPAVRVVTPNL